MARYEGKYHDSRRRGSPSRHANSGELYIHGVDSRLGIFNPRNYHRNHHNNHDSHHHNNNNINNIGDYSAGATKFVPQKKRSALFNNQGPAHHGDGRDAAFGKNRRPAHEMRPFSTFMPFSIDSHPKAIEMSADIKRQFHEMNPGISKEGRHMDYIYRSWARTPDRPLSEVHRYHAFRKMLEYGTVDEISAEVFHFLCGIHQYKYGDGFMRDDMELCDCDGKVSRCFVAAYMELAWKLRRTEKMLSEAYRAANTGTTRPSRSTTRLGPVLEEIE